jgi:pyrroloquinoline quinone (PQQ) biosynthesis protein C
MILKTTRKPTKAERLREQIEHLSVDVEYAGREGDSAYSERVNKKLDKLYNMLDRIVSRGKKV